MARCDVGFKKYKSQKKQKKHKNDLEAIYEEPAIAEKIPLKYINNIQDKRYHEHLIYESYKPRNLREMQNFLHFVLNYRKILPNSYGKYSTFNMEDSKANKDVEEILNSGQVSQEIKNYYNSEVETKLPSQLSK